MWTFSPTRRKMPGSTPLLVEADHEPSRAVVQRQRAVRVQAEVGHETIGEPLVGEPAPPRRVHQREPRVLARAAGERPARHEAQLPQGRVGADPGEDVLDHPARLGVLAPRGPLPDQRRRQPHHLVVAELAQPRRTPAR
ncbi:hypothetical protein GCM10010182_28050 [Actinomadura cremea]|nr:hypothetical protein GCM10010182_28050 [Actinomadura cremea]